MVSKDELSEKLNRFRNAWGELSQAWLDSEYADSFDDSYPFQRSFDEHLSDVVDWVEMCQREMFPEYQKTFEDMIKSRSFLPADVYCDTEGMNVEDIGLTPSDNVVTYFQHYYIAVHANFFEVTILNNSYQDKDLFKLEKLLWDEFLQYEMN